MKKAIYKNTFYIAATFLVIALLFCKNFFKLMMSGDILAAAVLTIQAIVLYQIKIKHEYVILGIRTWAIYPIIKDGIMVGIAFLYFIEGGSEFITTSKTFWSTLQFFAGILIFYFADSAIEVVTDE